jgi:hypothetical protein
MRLSYRLAGWEKDGDLDIIALDAPRMFLDQVREDHFGFGIGSDIFIPSAFVSMAGEKQNIPIVRFGHVAAVALEPTDGSPRKPAFLIETRSLGGMSGSPVMFHTDTSGLLYPRSSSSITSSLIDCPIASASYYTVAHGSFLHKIPDTLHGCGTEARQPTALIPDGGIRRRRHAYFSCRPGRAFDVDPRQRRR